MKYFLAKFTIYDGTHEHGDQFLVKAKSLNEAQKIAVKEEHDTESGDMGTFWNHGDGLTASKLQTVEEIEKAEAEVLNRLGLAYFAN
ncbi:MAG: hypothetical protein CL608_04530 [Anaerolineaceae bacterium]|nr:hypothetical protein [Anaerolineaceae bacterium]